jgi:hypothetical protein
MLPVVYFRHCGPILHAGRANKTAKKRASQDVFIPARKAVVMQDPVFPAMNLCPYTVPAARKLLLCPAILRSHHQKAVCHMNPIFLVK